LVGSGLFIAALLFLLIGNEFLRHRYARTHVQLATWFFLFLPYTTLALPVLLGRIGDLVFLFSGFIALMCVAGLVWVVRRVATEAVYTALTKIAVSISLIYGIFTTFYFLNLIPPVPLSLTHIGMYHALERDAAGNYLVAYEKPAWWALWRDTSPTFTYTSGDPGYCFSAVFAPSSLSVPIFHRWEKYDEVTEEWKTITYLSFPINGGRSGGYRGYSETYRLSEGRWRCSVETQRGALIGRTIFTVVSGEPQLFETTL